ncbi:hypothetical protein BTO02_27360 [Paraburkholderia sp. SOS3]|nr:hypothetical protein BTO02_27360 [Paraburkholderia sp. SOS3]
MYWKACAKRSASCGPYGKDDSAYLLFDARPLTANDRARFVSSMRTAMRPAEGPVQPPRSRQAA